MRTVVLALVLLSIPMTVWGADSDADDEYVTLFRHDFDAQDPYWVWVIEDDFLSGNIREGYAFLNMTEKTTSWPPVEEKTGWETDYGSGRGWETHPTKGRQPYQTKAGQWMYASMEIRLRCSDDNQQESEEGGGMRYWGLINYPRYPRHNLIFISWSPGSNQEEVGFWAREEVRRKTRVMEPLTGIDMREWHTYTILWEEDNATFLVDGQVVGIANSSPTVPLFGCVLLENSIYLGEHGDSYSTSKDGDLGYTDVVGNVSLQVDHIRLFASKERFDAWSGAVSRAEELLDEADKKGINTTELVGDYFDVVKVVWREGYYNYHYIKPYLDRIIPYLEHFDEISEMFLSCEERIEKSRQGGAADRTIRMMEGYYAQAQKYWGEYNYEDTEYNLQRIMAMPEPALLPILSILGLILLPTHLRKHARPAN